MKIDCIREYADDDYNKERVKGLLLEGEKIKMGQQLQVEEPDWDFLVTDALIHGWIIEKSGERAFLEPPVDFLYAHYAIETHKVEYRKRQITVPNFVLDEHVRHNVK